uniref:F-box domain-containing protein n=1 Tax=Pithovirus LCDPAC01 TaxID=2506600 RepID=A0A481YNU3_9VIRU|nr:MAG: hypothetical protein LCDPAC01_02380 [Pithovirus LCDPAC01]
MNFGEHYIPREIVGDIVSHVSNPRDLIHLMGTSKLFRFYAEPQLETKQKKVIKKWSDYNQILYHDRYKKICKAMLKHIAANQWILNQDSKFKRTVSKKVTTLQRSHNLYIRQLAKKYQHLV